MGLNAEEKKALEALTAKSKEPDAPAGNVSFTLDLGNDAAYERGKRLGLFSEPAEEPPEGDGDGDGNATPKRRGFFPEPS